MFCKNLVFSALMSLVVMSHATEPTPPSAAASFLEAKGMCLKALTAAAGLKALFHATNSALHNRQAKAFEHSAETLCQKHNEAVINTARQPLAQAAITSWQEAGLGTLLFSDNNGSLIGQKSLNLEGNFKNLSDTEKAFLNQGKLNTESQVRIHLNNSAAQKTKSAEQRTKARNAGQVAAASAIVGITDPVRLATMWSESKK